MFYSGYVKRRDKPLRKYMEAMDINIKETPSNQIVPIKFDRVKNCITRMVMI